MTSKTEILDKHSVGINNIRPAKAASRTVSTTDQIIVLYIAHYTFAITL